MESILEEAIRIRGGERNADYGDAVENFRRITEIANTITGLTLTESQVCKIMMAVKLARQRHRHKRDNLVDLCGYADILNLIDESEISRPAKPVHQPAPSTEKSKLCDVADIISEYATACGFTYEDIIAPGRKPEHHAVRQLIYIRLKADGHTYSAIGRMFNRNHSSIISAINYARALIEINDPLIMRYMGKISLEVKNE